MKAFDMGIKFIRARCITLYMYFLRKQTETEKSGHNVQAENMTQLYQPDHITTTRTLTEEASYKYLYVKGNISVNGTSTYINIITKISFPL